MRSKTWLSRRELRHSQAHCRQAIRNFSLAGPEMIFVLVIFPSLWEIFAACTQR